MGRYYNLLFISEFEDDIFFDIFKNLIKEVGINAIVHNLSNMNENLNFYDLVFFNMRKLNMDEKYKHIYNNILKCNLPIISFNGYTELGKDKLKETVKIIEEGKEKTDLKIEKVHWLVAAFSGYISGKLFKNDKLNVIGNILMHLCRFKDVNRYSEGMEKVPFEKYIFINYTKHGNKINEDDLRWNKEQLEILVQILLNKGNKIIITSTGEENKCKEFINRFQDKNVKYIPSKDTFKLLNMINNSSMIIDMGTIVSTIAAGLGKPFISIGCDLDFLDLKSIIKEDTMFLSAFDMNAGKIINNIENINKNYNELCIKLKKTADEYYNLALMFLKKVFNTVESKNKVTYTDKRKNKNNLVSVVLLAYNHLDYTKKCIESILEFTKDINYELILVNNGSTDETKDYFDSLDNVKIVNIEKNVGICNGFDEGIFYSNGKYIACVCNDFIFTYNWLDDLIKCIESDDKIGYVSSGASSMSNLHRIDLKFSNIQEMNEKASLLPCVLMCRAELLKKVGWYDPVFYNKKFLNTNIESKEYKVVFEKNAYSMKIALGAIENKLLDERNVCLGGIKLLRDSFELNYNLACFYENIGEYDNAIKIYNKTLELTDDIELKKQIYNHISEIKMMNYEVVVKSPRSKIKLQSQNNVYTLRKNYLDATREDSNPIVSIFILAYNNLEKYTKKCVECVLKYTKDVDYELILVDNGSNDGTFEYFKDVKHPRKRVVRITKNVAAGYGAKCGYEESNGKYIINMPNDVYVTKNWLSNMLKCAMSDDKIGMVNPVCDYVTNQQSINLGYKDFDDMQVKAEKYNVSDSRKWEERVRLITLGTLFKKECLDVIGFIDYGFFHDFADDDITFRVRRAGYKAVLCKDAFVCHAGKITDKGVAVSSKSLQEGRKIFKDKYYGIDAWNDASNYECTMISSAEIQFNKCEYNILGIDVLCGTPILELKNKLRNNGIFDTRLSSFSTAAKYWLDLKTICDGKVEVDRIEYLFQHFKGDKFDYIILGKPINSYDNPYEILEQMVHLLTSHGQLLLKLENTNSFIKLLKNNSVDLNISQISLKNITIDKFYNMLKNHGYYAKSTKTEMYNLNSNLLDSIKANILFSSKDDYKKSLIKYYVINIAKQE
ncbi:glycosyltransferase [Clostridium coskatii]|uniref:N-glycosyltransferase n=1 Tax=Clostridium coskatii TaxID=1705578 RepID=A0A162LHR3_9CLOT|nr:glycosyltransferase [Clostridium coskatii]OAA93666.1 N-glycosyltransferase [Clostridium coskatii]OBR89972.1 N-glycosyltransferase [Clostridium coskatii]